MVALGTMALTATWQPFSLMAGPSEPPREYTADPRKVLSSKWVSFDGSKAGTPLTVKVDGTVKPETGVTALQVKLPGVWVDEIDFSGKRFQAVRLPRLEGRAPSLGMVGYPAVPVLPLSLGVITDAATLQTSSADYAIKSSKVLSNLLLEPYTDGAEDETRKLTQDAKAYASGTAWPSRTVSARVGRRGILPAGDINVIPATYVASKKSLTVLTDFTVKVRTPGPVIDIPCFDVSPNWDAIYRASIANYSVISPYLGPIGYHKPRYLVITTDIYDATPTLDAFRDYKRSQGLVVDTAVVSVDMINDCNGIQGYIRDYYNKNSCGDVYTLLVGDLNDVNTCYYTGAAEPNAPSDYMLSLVSGADQYSDVFLGRLSVDSELDLAVQTAKIEAYASPKGLSLCSTDWMKQVELAAHKQDYPGKYTQAMEDVRTYPYALSTPTFHTVYGGDADPLPNRNDDVEVDLELGRNIMMYRGHGSSSSWSGWDAAGSSWTASGQVAGLLNGTDTPIVMSIACDNAALDVEDSIAEAWMEQDGDGAVAHYGASRNSYTTENHDIARFLMRSIYDEGLFRMGPALAWTASQVVPLGDHGTDNINIYNLLGDPHMDIRTDSCMEIFVSGPFDLPSGNYVVKYHVSDAAGKPVPSAMVSVEAATTPPISLLGVTNANGDFSASVSVERGGRASVASFNDGLWTNNLVPVYK